MPLKIINGEQGSKSIFELNKFSPSEFTKPTQAFLDCSTGDFYQSDGTKWQVAGNVGLHQA